MIVHYEYRIDYFVYEARFDFHAIGYAMVLLSVVLGLWSGGEYFVGFLKGIGARDDAANG